MIQMNKCVNTWVTKTTDDILNWNSTRGQCKSNITVLVSRTINEDNFMFLQHAMFKGT